MVNDIATLHSSFGVHWNEILAKNPFSRGEQGENERVSDPTLCTSQMRCFDETKLIITSNQYRATQPQGCKAFGCDVEVLSPLKVARKCRGVFCKKKSDH